MTRTEQAPERIYLTTTQSGKVDEFTMWGDPLTQPLHPETPRTEYRRADVPPTPAEAMRCPEVGAMREILEQWSAAFWVADQFAVAIHDDEGKCYSIRAQDFHRMSDLYRASTALNGETA